MSECEGIVRRVARGVQIRVRLTPKSASDGVGRIVEAPQGRALQARVRAAPEGGRANAALTRLIAAWLDIPQSSVTLSSGARSRYKQVEIEGDSRQLTARIAGLLEKQTTQVQTGR